MTPLLDLHIKMVSHLLNKSSAINFYVALISKYKIMKQSSSNRVGRMKMTKYFFLLNSFLINIHQNSLFCRPGVQIQALRLQVELCQSDFQTPSSWLQCVFIYILFFSSVESVMTYHIVSPSSTLSSQHPCDVC